MRETEEVAMLAAGKTLIVTVSLDPLDRFTKERLTRGKIGKTWQNLA